MTYPIPNEALDDRLAIVGTAGSGKTYTASGAVERVLSGKGRVIVIDPLGVWFGLRLAPDGITPSKFNPVIFGGPHGDLPINEHAGALIGETVAGMAESCIVDLTDFGTKAGERRFMLAFLTALYRKANKEPVHIIFDEADMFAPQKLDDKEGEAAKLLGMMETLIRRGRIKGFIPWLITQRPAVLNKNVLSQADGVIAMKMTGEHDRKAIGAWIEGQADPSVGKEILASLASKQQGEGVVWIPSRYILESVKFPEKMTFDSSRTPKRGEKRRRTDLTPLDLGSLKERLTSVETELKDNDPKLLRAEIAKLRKMAVPSNAVEKINMPDPKALEQAFQDGHAIGYEKGYGDAARLVREGMSASVANAMNQYRPPEPSQERIPQKLFKSIGLPKTPSRVMPVTKTNGSGNESLNSAAAKMLAVMDTNPPVRRSWQQIATLAGLRARGGHFNTGKKGLVDSGLIEESDGLVSIVKPSAQAANPDTDPADVVKLWESNLSGAAPKILRHLFDYGPATREGIAEHLQMQPRGGHWNTAWKELRDNNIVQIHGGIAHLTELFL